MRLEILKHESDTAGRPIYGPGVWRRARNRHLPRDFPFGKGRNESVETAAEGRLSSAGLPHDDDKFRRIMLIGNVVQGGMAGAAIRKGQTADIDDRIGQIGKVLTEVGRRYRLCGITTISRSMSSDFRHAAHG